MKTIVIPAKPHANFSKLAHAAMSFYVNEAVHCIFLDIRSIPSNYNDLLTISSKNTSSNLGDIAFYQTEKDLKKVFGDRIEIEEDHLYGDSSPVFRNYVDHREVDLVIYDEKQWNVKDKHSNLNVFRMVSRCGCELMYLSSDALEDNYEDVIKHPKQPKREKSKPEPHAGNVAIALQRIAEDAPQSVHYQFQAVDAMLNELQQNFYKSRILSKKLNNVSRYFLKETSLQKILAKSECSMLLIQK